MRRLIVAASVGGLLAIKLIPVQRHTRHLHKHSDPETSSSNSGSNQVVLDQIQSVKKVLAHSEAMRTELNELVAEFSTTESQRRKVGLYNRAQTLVMSFLEKYDKGDVAKSCANKEDCNIGNAAYSNELREQIRLAFEREGHHYLELMNGVIQHGWMFIDDKGSSDKSMKTEPSLAASAASFKTRDDVKAVFLYWKDRIEKAKQAEKDKKASENYAFYSMLGCVAAIIAAAWYGYQFYISKYGSPSTKLSYRRKQLQRRQYITNAINVCTQWGKSALKLSSDFYLFVLFLGFVGATTLIELTSQIKSKILAARTNVSSTTNSTSNKKTASRQPTRRKKTYSNKAHEISVETIVGTDQISNTTTVQPTEESSPIVVETVLPEEVVELSASPCEDSVEVSVDEVVASNDNEADTAEIIFTTTKDETDACGRGESPNSVVRVSSTEEHPIKSSEECSGNEEDLPLSFQSASYALEKLSVASAYSSDDEGWTVLDSTQAARIRVLRKKAQSAASGNGRGRTKEGRSRKSPTPASVSASVSLPRVARAPQLKQTSMSTAGGVPSSSSPAPTAVESVVKPVVESIRTAAALSSADSTDQESVEEYHDNNAVITSEKDDVHRDSPLSDKSDNGLIIDTAVTKEATELVSLPSPEPIYMGPNCAAGPGPYYMVPQMLPQGMAWPTMAPHPYYPGMPANVPYCYGPPSPYAVPMTYPVMDGYVVEGMQPMAPVSPTVAVPPPPPPQVFPVLNVVDDRLTEAIRHQVDYYFSVENLCRDVYLRNKMDGQGFVLLEEIIQFNRIRHLNAPLIAVLRAVESSSNLEVLQPWAAKVSGSQISDRAILDTKIRCAIGWDRWILSGNSAGNKVEVQP